jgi:hypothetical protein
MEKHKLIKEILKANFHKGGIKCLKLFKLKDHFFTELRAEILNLAAFHKPSNVLDKNHISNAVTKPYGKNYQYSLFNESGRLNDPSKDWNKSWENKKFHYDKEYPIINAFINFFPNITNMKLLALGPHSGLYPHEAHIIAEQNNKRFLILRFHLPIMTNPYSEMLLDNEFYNFKQQYIYFFNEGCIHSAYNGGSNFRYHLSWDMHLTDEVYQLMFSNDPFENEMLQKISSKDQNLLSHRMMKVRNYELQGKSKLFYDKFHLHKWGIKPEPFNRFYNELSYLKYKLKENKYLDITLTK